MINDYFLDPKNYTTKEILEEDEKYVLDVGLPKENLVLVSGDGCNVQDLDGNEYLNFMSSTANVSAGFRNKQIINTMIKQLNLLSHSQMVTTNIPKVKLAKLMLEIYPKEARMKKFFTTGGGSEANEAMIKLSRKYTAHRFATKFISWWESYHGPTMGALSATGQKMSKAPYLEPLSPTFIHVPTPDCGNCAFGKSYPKCKIQCARFVKELIDVEQAESFSGMLFEPISSALGGLVPPREYFEIINDICEKEDIVLMFDEVVAGFGRTGKMFGSEHYKIYPKMTSFAKSFVSGYATASGILINEDIEKSGAFGNVYHGSTCSGNILSSAVAYANINYIIDNKLVNNSKIMGEYLLEKLIVLKEKYPNIVDTIRGKGLMGSIVFNKKLPLEKITDITKNALEMGLIIRANTRLRDHIIWYFPPLIISKDEIDFAVEVIFNSFKRVFG